VLNVRVTVAFDVAGMLAGDPAMGKVTVCAVLPKTNDTVVPTATVIDAGL
jgi:hypothetical protein